MDTNPDKAKRNKRITLYLIGGLLVLATVLSILNPDKPRRPRATKEQQDVFFAGLRQQFRMIRAIEAHGESLWIEIPLSSFGVHLKQEAHEVASVIARGYAAQLGGFPCVHIHAGSFDELGKACATAD